MRHELAQVSKLSKRAIEIIEAFEPADEGTRTKDPTTMTCPFCRMAGPHKLDCPMRECANQVVTELKVSIAREERNSAEVSLQLVDAEELLSRLVACADDGYDTATLHGIVDDARRKL